MSKKIEFTLEEQEQKILYNISTKNESGLIEAITNSKVVTFIKMNQDFFRNLDNAKFSHNSQNKILEAVLDKVNRILDSGASLSDSLNKFVFQTKLETLYRIADLTKTHMQNMVNCKENLRSKYLNISKLYHEVKEICKNDTVNKGKIIPLLTRIEILIEEFQGQIETPTISTTPKSQLLAPTDILKNKEIVSEKNPVNQTKQNIIKDLNEGKFEKLKSIIFNANLNILDFLDPALFTTIEQINNFTSKQNILLLLLESMSALDKNEPTRQKDYKTKLAIFEAKCKFALGKSIVEQFAEDKRSEVKKDKYTEAIDYCDKANFICVKYMADNTQNNIFVELSVRILSYVQHLITQYENPQDAYTFSTISLQSRSENIKENTQTKLYGYISAAQASLAINNNEAKQNAIKYCEAALNIDTINYIQKSLVYKCLANLYNHFGDNNKADTMEKFSQMFKEGKFDEKGFIYNPIIKFGSTSKQEQEIKLLIQKDVLNKVFNKAKQGKWYDYKLGEYGIGIGEYGIDGYVNKEYISKILGKANNDENVQTALKFVFETINIAIMSNPAPQNPLCAVIFAQKYPDLLKDIISTHPEFLVDTFILKNVIMNAHELSEELAGIKLAKNVSYNAAFESSILPFIHERIDNTVFTPIKKLITAKNWNEQAESTLVHYLSKEYLSSGILKTTLGKNLSEVQDIYNIIIIEAFKVINNAIKDIKSTNYNPVEVFIKHYANSEAIIERIQKDHSDCFANAQIKDLFVGATTGKKLFESTIIGENVPHAPDDEQNHKDVDLVGEQNHEFNT